MFGVLMKADRIKNLATVFEGSKATLSDLNCEKFFATSALNCTGVEEPFAAAAELFERKDADSRPRSLQAGKQDKCC
jgi:hypothetical protein